MCTQSIIKCSSVYLNNIITILYIIINYETHLHRHTSEERIMFGGHPMSALQSTESRLWVCAFRTAHLSVKRKTSGNGMIILIYWLRGLYQNKLDKALCDINNQYMAVRYVKVCQENWINSGLSDISFWLSMGSAQGWILLIFLSYKKMYTSEFRKFKVRLR